MDIVCLETIVQKYKPFVVLIYFYIMASSMYWQ